MTTMPVDDGFVVTSNFGMRTGDYAGMHWGTDFGKAGGSGGYPVYAIRDGSVTHSGAASGFGQWVVLDHPSSVGGGTSVYGHVIPEVTVGQSVREGQRIARINPDSATNGGVAPHCHVEWHRFVWSPPGPDRLDPMTILTGAKWPGKAAENMPEKTPTTIFGIDISSHQDGLPLSIAAADGYKFAILKATEGHTYRDPVFHSHLADARANGLLTAAYLYVWWNSTPAQMAQALADHVNDTTVPVILDIEDNAGFDVGHWKATVQELNARGYRTPMIYLPKWYWRRAGSPSLAGLPPLWSSVYKAGTGIGSVVYRNAGGDNGEGWDSYGGLEVVMWQFTDGAVLSNGRAVDGNAYKGSRVMLEALFNGDLKPNGEDMSREAELKIDAIYNQLTGSFSNGEYPGFDINALYATAAGKGFEKLTMMEAVAVATRESILAGDQLSGPGRNAEGARTFNGWDIPSVLNAARKRNYAGLTLVQMLAVSTFGTDADRAAIADQVKGE